MLIFATPLEICFFGINISNFIKPCSNNVFKFIHTNGLIFLVCLPDSSSYLIEHKNKHRLLNTPKTIYN